MSTSAASRRRRSGEASRARADRRPAPPPARVDSEPQRVGPPGWVPVTGLVLSVLGLAVSGYLTLTHYDKSLRLTCPATGAINCEKVTQSAQSIIFGIPVPVFGLLFFVGMIVLNLPQLWRNPRPEIRWIRLAAAVVGIGFVIYLIYTELFVVSAICLWCTSVHALTLLLLVTTLIGTTSYIPPEPEWPE